jgi:hypothetical protein
MLFGLLVVTMGMPVRGAMVISAEHELHATGTDQEEQVVTASTAGVFDGSVEVDGIAWFLDLPEGQVRGTAQAMTHASHVFTESTMSVSGWGIGLTGTAFGRGTTEYASVIEISEPTTFQLEALLNVTPFDWGLDSSRLATFCFHPVGTEQCQIDVSEFLFGDEITQLTISDHGELEPGQYQLSATLAATGTFNREASAELYYRLDLTPVAADIDSLGAAIRQNSTDLQYDVDASNSVDQGDLTFLVVEHLQTWFGDSNLDGFFDTDDLIAIFQAGQYDDGVSLNSTWSTGDWNQDAEFDSADLIVAFQDGGYLQGPRPVAAQVPEPSCVRWIVAACTLGLLGARRRD